jgi:predicted GNAT family acetyltransferase
MRLDIRHEESDHRFVAHANGLSATLDYEPLGGETVDFRATYVPDALRGQLVGTRLVLFALDWARQRGHSVVPSCWFVGSVIERHPEYRSLLAPR